MLFVEYAPPLFDSGTLAKADVATERPGSTNTDAAGTVTDWLVARIFPVSPTSGSLVQLLTQATLLLRIDRGRTDQRRW